MTSIVGIQVVNQVITWLLIVVGWVTVHYLTHTRERQKEVRELKTNLIERILEIERRSIVFHQSANYNQDEARALLAEIERVSSGISRRPLLLLALQPKVMRLFRSSITLKNFDPTSFQPQSATSKLLSDISLRTESLTAALEQAYAQRYLNAWWQAFRV